MGVFGAWAPWDNICSGMKLDTRSSFCGCETDCLLAPFLINAAAISKARYEVFGLWKLFVPYEIPERRFCERSISKLTPRFRSNSATCSETEEAVCETRTTSPKPWLSCLLSILIIVVSLSASGLKSVPRSERRGVPTIKRTCGTPPPLV